MAGFVFIAYRCAILVISRLTLWHERSGHLLYEIAIAIYFLHFSVVIFRILFNMSTNTRILSTLPPHLMCYFIFFFWNLPYSSRSHFIETKDSNVQIPQFTFCSISFNGSSSFLMYDPLSLQQRSNIHCKKNHNNFFFVFSSFFAWNVCWSVYCSLHTI